MFEIESILTNSWFKLVGKLVFPSGGDIKKSLFVTVWVKAKAVYGAGGAETSLKYLTEQRHFSSCHLSWFWVFVRFSFTLLYIPNLHVNGSGVKCLSVFNKGWKCPGYWPAFSYVNC